MKTRPRLALGTAQFGGHYGISNRDGRPDEREIAAILERASEAGIDMLDCATAYGGAEAIVGRWLGARRLRVVTKVPAVQSAVIEASDGAAWLDVVAQSIERLRVEKLDSLLVHHAADFAKAGWQHLRDALATAQQRGWTARVGASIYDAEQLALVESRMNVEVVQLPLNVLDRRPIESGLLQRLATAGKEIHIRSVFLQGLLLMAPEELPGYFWAAREQIVGLQRRWQERGLSALAGCLAFVAQRTEVDRIVVGVNRRAELDEIIDAWRQAGDCAIDFGPTPDISAAYLDPSRWPKAVA